MNKTKQSYIDFDAYIRQGEPDQREKAILWSTAIGLQKVDGLETSAYLQEIARRNIEGEISLDETKLMLRRYYESQQIRTQTEVNHEEADLVSANIAQLLSQHTLAFSIIGITSTHKAIFQGVFKHAGKIRDYNISKKEFVLRGESVAYMEHEWIRKAIEYDLQQERDFDYKGLSKDGIIQHLCRFTAGLWEIHPFCEGNTRTTAVFLIQYLRSMGFDIDNDTFALHSWYFRNALVRANYSNPLKGVMRDYSFLEMFMRNLLLGEQNVLKNRYMIICPPNELLPSDKLSDKLPDKLPDKLKCVSVDKFQTDNANIIKLVKVIDIGEWSVKDLLRIVGLKDRENFLNNMLSPAISQGFVRMLYPDSPRHPRQRYVLTVKGNGLLEQIKKKDKNDE